MLLVRAQPPVGEIEVDRVRRARRVPGEVFGGPADLDELLLDLAARPRSELVAVPVDAAREQRGYLAVRGDLGEHGGVGRPQHEHPLLVPLDDETPVPPDCLGDVGRDRLRHRKLRVAVEHGEHLGCLVAGRPRVPEAQPGDAVRVHMLGSALERGEHGVGVAGLLSLRVGDLQQHGAVALNDEGAVRIHNGPV